MSADRKIVPLVAKKSFKEGCVAVAITLKAIGWGNDSARISASTELTTVQARALAQQLIALAEAAEARIERKEAKKASRKKWREREIAAGRMIVMESFH